MIFVLLMCVASVNSRCQRIFVNLPPQVLRIRGVFLHYFRGETKNKFSTPYPDCHFWLFYPILHPPIEPDHITSASGHDVREHTVAGRYIRIDVFFGLRMAPAICLRTNSNDSLMFAKWSAYTTGVHWT